VFFKSLFKSSLAVLKDEIKQHFAQFLEDHNFVSASDPVFEEVYKNIALLYRSPKFEIFIARRGDVSVSGRPTYTDESWISIAAVLDIARGSEIPIGIKTSELASLMEEHYEFLERFFSRAYEKERKLAYQSIYRIREYPARKSKG